ncbi:hypothetical protein [Sinorhizobium meliloti]|uniref:hypothetical protein n=1 Tax=Rhizobium meliloti TaxID=382 RepID=UPI0012949168|nr:hypothetical protein [Sinorhizobium meliloti]MDW9491677.1 hypothetical protein [Sinorhizobium meliloti]MQV02943.1 hypothetical protein [Sinorhizobium meliloti]
MAQITSLPFTGSVVASLGNAWSADGRFLAVSHNTSSTTDAQVSVFELVNDELIAVAVHTGIEYAYGSVGIGWHSSGEILFVQCNRTSGQAPGNYCMFFAFDKVAKTLTPVAPPRPTTTGTGFSYAAVWWDDYAVTHYNSQEPYFAFYKYVNASTPLTRIDPVANGSITNGAGQGCGVAIHPSGTFAIAVQSSGQMVRIDKSGETFTISNITLPDHGVASNTIQNVAWDETGEYLFYGTQQAAVPSELFQYNSTTQVFTKLTIPTGTTIGRAFYWDTRKKGFVQVHGNSTTTIKPQLLKKNVATGDWEWTDFESDFPALPNARNVNAGAGSSLLGMSFASLPQARAWRVTDLITTTGAITSKKPVANFNVAVVLGVTAPLTAPKGAIDGDVEVPSASYGIFRAPKPITEGAITAAAGEEPAVEFFRTFPAVVMIENSAFGFKDQEATSNAIYGGGRAPKATFAGRFKQPIQVNGVLASRKANATGTLFLIEPDRRTLIANWSAPKPAGSGEVALGLSVMTSNLSAPKARFAGLGELPAAGRADVVAPKSGLNGLLYHYYVHADMIARLPTAKGTLEQPRVTIDEGLSRAPLPVVDGTTEIFQGVRSSLQAPKAALEGQVWQDIHANGSLAAPKARVVGELAAPAFIGSLVAPKAQMAGVIEAPVAFGSLLAPGAKLFADVTVATGVSGELRAPKAKLVGEVLRYIRVDILARAPSAKLSGQIHRVPKLQGSLKAPKSKISGTIRTSYDVQAAALAPAGNVAGKLVTQYLINAEGRAPSAFLEGDIKLRYLLEGNGLAPSPDVDGSLGISVQLSGDVSAPSAKLQGVVTQITMVLGDLVAPKANTNADIQLSNLVTITGFSPSARFSGTLKLEYGLEGELSGPSAISSGFLQSQLEFFGEAIAPSPVVLGESSLLMKRRQLRIIIPFNRATM